MPDEPKQNIEEQLRAFAKQRRKVAGTSFELPAAARERLQSEVERTYARPRSTDEEPGLIGWLAGFGLRFAVGGVAFAVLALAAIFWLPDLLAPRVELAKHSAPADESRIERLGANVERKREAQLRGRPEGPAIAGGGGERTSEFFRKSGADRDISLGIAPPGDALVLAPQTPQGPPARPTRESAALEKADSYSLTVRAPQAPASVPLTAAESIAPLPAPTTPQLADSKLSQAEVRSAVGGDAPSDAPVALKAASTRQESSVAGARPQARFAFENEGAVPLRGANQDLRQMEVEWSFQQSDARANYRRNFNSPPAPQVLSFFQVQQAGGSLRVTDADGSVYEGAFESEVRAQQPTTAMNSPASRSRAAGRGGRGGFSQTALNEPATTPQPSQASAMSDLAVGRSFRVVGTNRTLNRLVVLSGQFQATTNLQRDALGRGIEANAASGSRLELQGTAKVGQATEIPIRAFGQGP